MPLGERRSLVIVAVEGRRLLLGLTPTQISMVTELGPVRSFEQQLAERTRSSVTAPAPPTPGPIARSIFGGILQLSTNES